MSKRQDSPIYPKRVLERDGSDGRLGRAAGSAGMVLDSWRRRPGPRRVLRVLSVLLLLAGVGLIAYPFLTNLYADYRQGKLQGEFRSDEIHRRYVEGKVEVGQALTRIEIPRLGLSAIVVEGTSLAALRAGAGHYEGSALPCESGNAAIAGHRTTYSKPFARLNELKPGDSIVLETPVGRCRYRLESAPFVTAPTDWTVIRKLSGAFLTLTTCHPPGSAAERLVVRARLVSGLRA